MRQLVVRLTPWESRKLRRLRDQGTSARVVKRAACLLRSAAGEAAKDIARVLGLSADAVTDIRRRWRRRGLRSVRDRPRGGRPPRAAAGYRRELRRAMRAGPLRCGYVFTVWSIARLGAYLRRRTGVRLGATRLRQVVRREGLVVGRPAHTLRGKRDEAEHERARRRLGRLKRGP
jgi:transposase